MPLYLASKSKKSFFDIISVMGNVIISPFVLNTPMVNSRPSINSSPIPGRLH
jgi:hypothetical protein